MTARRVRALFVALVPLVAGCTHGAASRGDTLVIAVSTEPRSLNPLLLEGPTGAMVGSLLYSFLLVEGRTGAEIPDVATEVPTLANGGISRNGLRVVYHLRRGVRWEDGKPLTAADCVFTYRAIENPNNAIPSHYGYEDISRVRALGPYTLEVDLRKPARNVVTNFLALDGNYPIMPAHLLARYASIDHVAYDAQPIGSGPYRVTEWVRGDHLSLEANPSYFRGAARIARLRIEFISSDTTTLDELSTGEVSAAFALDPAVYPEARSLRGVRVVLTPEVGMGTILLNTARGPTADVRVRRAIAAAIDAPLIASKASRGAFLSRDAHRVLLALPATGPAQVPPYDPARARALLDAAGWRIGPGGIRMRDGRRLVLPLITSTYDPMSETVSTMVQAQLRAAGIDAPIRTYAPAIYMVPAAAGGPVFGGRFSLAYLTAIGESDGDLQFLYACSEMPPNGFDVTRLCDPRIDAVARAGSAAMRPSVATSDNEKFDALLEQDVPDVVLFQPRIVSVFTSRLRGFSPSPVTPYASAWTWHLVK
jgi:peptide/nickel transport system substrate-binding protein